MLLNYPGLSDEECAFLKAHARNLIQQAGVAWNLGILGKLTQLREVLVKIIGVLAWLLVILGVLSLLPYVFNGSGGDPTFLIFALGFAIALIVAIPYRHRFEKWFFTCIWKRSSKRVAAGLLKASTQTKRELEITASEIILQPHRFSTEKVSIIAESTAFLILVISHKKGLIPTPLFLFLRNTAEIQTALGQFANKAAKMQLTVDLKDRQP